MEEQSASTELRSDRPDRPDPGAVRSLFDRLQGLGPEDRDRLLRDTDVASAVLAEVKALLSWTTTAEAAESDPSGWRSDSRLGHVLRTPAHHWRLDAVIGEGGAGRVYRAVEVDTGESSAIKVLDRTRSSPERLARFRDEVRSLQRLDHPGIVRVLDSNLDEQDDSGDAEDRWIAVELVDGARTITEAALDLTAVDDAAATDRVLDLWADAIDAVSSAHRAGIVHRDLKPSNILVGTSGRVRLIDFGIARLIGVHAEGPTLSIDRTREGDLVGTPAYMAPEQVDPTLGTISTATDVHALGVVGYRLLTGRLPYAIGESLLSAAQAIRYVPPRDPRLLTPEIPEPIARLIERCLAKDPRDRPTDATELAEMLAQARRQSGSSMTGHATGGGHGRRVAVTVVAITAAIVGGAMLLPRSGGENTASITSFDPITQGTDDSRGAGDSEMKFRPFLGAVVSGAISSGSAYAQDYAELVMESDPIAYWRMGIDGGVVRNMIEGSPGLTPIGLPTADQTAVGCDEDISLRFNGNSYLSAGDDPRFEMEMMGDFSVEAWIKIPAQSDEMIISRSRDIVQGNWDVRTVFNSSIPDGILEFRLTYIGGASAAWNPSWSNNWIHIVGVADEATNEAVIYINGERSGSNELTAPIAGTANYPLLIGRHNVRGAYASNTIGSIDEVAIYDRALSPDEIAAHHAAADPDKLCTPACIGNFTQDEIVDAADLGILLAVWGDAAAYPEADLNEDGNIDAADLGLLLGSWGPCPE